MNKIITKTIGTALLVGSLMGCSPRRVESPPYIGQASITRSEKLNQTSWDVVDTNGDGSYNQLITPHRNGYYSTNGPVYVRGRGDKQGDLALDFAKSVIEYKNDFSRMCGKDEIFYWYCRVDDFNGDGLADKISWPRMEDKMPAIYREFFTKEVKGKADTVVSYENFILDYLARN